MNVEELITMNNTKFTTYFIDGDKIDCCSLKDYYNMEVNYFEICGEVVTTWYYEIIKYSMHIYTVKN